MNDKNLRVLTQLLPFLSGVDASSLVTIENSKTVAQLQTRDRTPFLVRSAPQVSANRTTTQAEDIPTTTTSTASTTRDSPSDIVFTDERVTQLNEELYFVCDGFVDEATIQAAKQDADRLFDNGALRSARIEDVREKKKILNKNMARFMQICL